MCEWAYLYLIRLFNMFSKEIWEDNYKFCMRVLDNQSGIVNKENLLKNMQAAWRQKNYRERQKSEGKKPCSFILSSAVLRELDWLASQSRASINETLEGIIHQNYIKRQKKYFSTSQGRTEKALSKLAQEVFNG